MIQSVMYTADHAFRSTCVISSAVKTMTAESPLSSIDIHPDGATLAIGTVRGKVYIYDLRYGAQPMNTLSAHKAAVQNIKFMNNLKVSKVSRQFSYSETATCITGFI